MSFIRNFIFHYARAAFNQFSIEILTVRLSTSSTYLHHITLITIALEHWTSFFLYSLGIYCPVHFSIIPIYIYIFFWGRGGASELLAADFPPPPPTLSLVGGVPLFYFPTWIKIWKTRYEVASSNSLVAERVGESYWNS